MRSAPAKALACAWLLLALAGAAIARGGEPAGDGSAACPESLDAWWSWRERQIAHLLEPLAYEGRTCLEIDGVAERARAIRELLEACEARAPETFAPGRPVAALLENLGRFVRALSHQAYEGSELGFAVPDRVYLEEVQDDIALPELLQSQPFLRAMRSPAGYRDARAMIERRNASLPRDARWVVLLYKSRFLKTPDGTTYGRFLVVVPGNPERWIQFGMATPDMDPATTIHSVSIVSLRDRGPSRRKESHIVDYWRSYEDDDIALRTKVEAGEGGANCYNCHKTPVLPIHPLEEYAFDAAGRLRVREAGAGEIPDRLNERIEGYGAPDFGPHFDPGAYGPSLAPMDRERSLEELRRWTRDLELGDASLARVRDHMVCSRCHHPSGVGRLNYPTAVLTDQDLVDLVHPETGEPTPLVRTYVEEGWMPPRNDLSPLERKALYRAVSREYYDREEGTGLLVDWLRSRSTH